MAAYDLRYELLREHSKAQCLRIVEWVGDDQKRFDELFHIFLTGEYRVVQHAAWPISYCVIAYPQLIKKHWTRLIKNLQRPDIHDAVKRNSIRLLQDIDIPGRCEGNIMDICFKYVASPTETVAVKAFSMTVLGKLAKKYPEILPELKLMIEEQLPYQTAAFVSRAKKILKM